jgi:feruloyl-CoA synthase
MKKYLAGTSAIAILVTLGQGTAAGQAAPARGTAPQLEHIIVTATHRKENLQKTAIAVTAVSAATLRDAAYLKDPDDPTAGLLFDGRIGEDFKLATGVWVNVAKLRARMLAATAPLVQDAIVVGNDRNEVGGLLIPDLAACRAFIAQGTEIWGNASIAAWLIDKVQGMGGGGSSEKVARIGVLRRPLSLDGGEITDKGSLNAKKITESRAALIEAMYREGPLVWE